MWLRENPARFALSAEAEGRLMSAVQLAAKKSGLNWQERNYLALRRGPYLIGAGLDESVKAATNVLNGRFVNLFDPELKVQTAVALKPGARVFLLDLDARKSAGPTLLASACKALLTRRDTGSPAWTVEGVGNTPALLLFSTTKAPRSIQLEQKPLDTFTFNAAEGLLYVRFPNEARPRDLQLEF
jgi:hypothetical protein